MFQNNPLLAQLKKQLHENTPRIEGTVRSHEKGFGFLELDNKKSYFIPVNKMRDLLPGDRVSGTITLFNDKEQFSPEILITSALEQFIGRIEITDKKCVIYADQFMTKNSILCQYNQDHPLFSRLQSGDWVTARMIQRPLKDNAKNFVAEPIDVITNKNEHISPWLLALTRYQLERHPPESVPVSLLEGEEICRVDLTDKLFFTIDNENTHDMDDAIHIELDANGDYQLMVAIADPSAYIAENDQLDVIAQQRCFTTYLPDLSIPMLPKNLSNDVCSLRPHEKRPALVFKVIVAKDGTLINHSQMDNSAFNIAWIESKHKLAYNTVSDYLENKGTWQPPTIELAQQLQLLLTFTKTRQAWRQLNSVVNKDQNDFRFMLDQNRHPVAIIKEERRIANQMIEEAMIVANQSFSNELSNKIGFGIFMTHSGFDAKYLDAVLKILTEQHNITDFDKERLSSFEGYCALRKLTENIPFLDMRLRNYLSPADFSLEPKPHFGLGFESYVTVTSPIRKYSDLVNHRLMKSYLRGETVNKPNESILQALSERRKKQRMADRDISDWLYSQYLVDKIDQSFTAEITNINKGGMRVKLVDIGAFAFVPATLIHSVRDEILVNPEEGKITVKEDKIYRIADVIELKLAEIKAESLTIIMKV